MRIEGEAYLNAYQRLRETPVDLRVEILAEWEMFSNFGEAADFVWADEWPKTVARVKERYVRTRHHPNVTEAAMIGDIWYFANIAGHLHRDDDQAQLCPYTCASHVVSKGIPY